MDNDLVIKRCVSCVFILGVNFDRQLDKYTSSSLMNFDDIQLL